LGLLPKKTDKWATSKEVYSNIAATANENGLTRDFKTTTSTSNNVNTSQINLNAGPQNSNKKTGTAQTFAVVVDLPKTGAEIAKFNQTKLEIIGTATTALTNKTNNSLAASNDKKTAGNDTKSIKIVNVNLLNQGIHPGDAVETFFPNQQKADSNVKTQSKVGTKSNQSDAREAVKQTKESSVKVGSQTKSTTTTLSVFSKTNTETNVTDLSKSKGTVRKDTADLLEHVIEEKALGFSKTTPVVANFRSKFKEFLKTVCVDIKKSVARQNLYFEVVLLEEGKEDFVLRQTFTVKHQNQIREFTVPDTKPTLRLAKQYKSSVSLMVEQKDPFATSILLEKRIYSNNIRVPDAFQVVQQIDITNRDKPITIDVPDTCISPAMLLYRAVPIGPLGQRGHAYTNLAVRGLPPPVSIRSGVSRSSTSTSSSFFAKSTTDGIRLTINSVPDDALSMYINKTEIGTQFAIDGRTGPIEVDTSGRQIKTLRGQKGTITILDRKVYDERSYRYTCIFKLPHAKRAASNNSEIIKFVRPFRQLPVEVAIKNLVIDENAKSDETTNELEANMLADQSSIKFLIETTPTETGIEEITQLLVDSNVSDIFIEDLRKDRSRLTSFAFFTVERVNLVTGKKDNFGIVSAGIFSDDPETRKKLKITPIAPGDKFEYIVKLFLKSPESMFKGATTLSTDNSSTALKNDTYAVKTLAQKFSTLYTRAKSLPSEVELLDKSPGSLSRQILRGETGYSKSIEARITPRKSSVASLDASRTILGYNEIKWKLKGDITTIDHFIVNASSNGKKYPIGVVTPNKKENTFYDKKMCNTIGTVTYTIDIVELDFSRETQSMSTSITRQQTLPAALIEELTRDETKMPPTNSIALDLQVGVDVKTRVAVKDTKFNKNIFSPPEIKR
jgi:hypothetical protein